MLVLTKIDLNYDQSGLTNVLEYAQKNGWLTAKTSSLLGKNIEEAFEKLIVEAVDRKYGLEEIQENLGLNSKPPFYSNIVSENEFIKQRYDGLDQFDKRKSVKRKATEEKNIFGEFDGRAGAMRLSVGDDGCNGEGGCEVDSPLVFRSDKLSKSLRKRIERRKKKSSVWRQVFRMCCLVGDDDDDSSSGGGRDRDDDGRGVDR